MKHLLGEKEKEAIEYMLKAAKIAENSSCLRAKCGSILVKDKEIIGTGFNSPPCNEKLEKCLKDCLPENFKSDKTCCIHAEQRVIFDALRKNPEKIKGSRIYFARLDEKGNIEKAGNPYCTICSKMSLDVGIKEFVLWHKEGIYVYNTREYNNHSFNHKEQYSERPK